MKSRTWMLAAEDEGATRKSDDKPVDVVRENRARKDDIFTTALSSKRMRGVTGMGQSCSGVRDVGAARGGGRDYVVWVERGGGGVIL